MKEVIFTANAYSKMIMHCAKYPHCAVNGVLLAADSKTDDKTNTLTCIDAVPLFHLCLHVTPMVEIAMSQIELWAESTGQVIAGYYLANENLNDMSYDRPAHKLADKICEKFRSSCLVVIDNKLVTLTHDTPAIRTFQNVDGKWKQMESQKITVDEDALEITSFLLRDKIYYDLIDFDNHLDSISLEWKNEDIKELTESLLLEKRNNES